MSAPLPRVVAVTGSASGIGAATAARLRAGGDRVIGVDRQHADVVADLGTPEGRRTAIAEVTASCDGRLDGLVTCAGLAGAPDRPGAPLAAVNYFGSVELLVGLRPALAAGRRPAAVALSSNSTTCQPGVPADVVEACLAGDEPAALAAAESAGSLPTYPATKLAVARWVRRQSTTPDWAGSGIRLNAIAPGMIDTPMTAEVRADPVLGPLMEAFPVPAGRPGRPEEVAALIALLLGEEGGFFCGSVLYLDGGTDALLHPDDWPAPWALDLG